MRHGPSKCGCFPFCGRHAGKRIEFALSPQSTADDEADCQGYEASFWEDLPAIITVYRGCARTHVAGLSWTISREVAEKFATGHRDIRVLDPVIASAQIGKENILGTFDGRDEAEILLDPASLAELQIEAFTSAQPSWEKT